MVMNTEGRNVGDREKSKEEKLWKFSKRGRERERVNIVRKMSKSLALVAILKWNKGKIEKTKRDENIRGRRKNKRRKNK